jgi:integrase
MSQHNELPPRVYPKGRWYYLVTADGKKRVWTKLTMIRDGISALYRKLADMKARDVAPDRMPLVAQAWLAEACADHADKRNDEWACREISEALAEFRAREVTTPDCIAFLKTWKDKKQARTFNLMRFALLDMMRFAEGKATDGVPFRDPGTNPVASIKRMSTPARTRYPTDSEVRRIKFHAMVGRNDRWGNRTFARSGPMLACLIDLAYLTGQRVGDLLDLRWNKRAATEGGKVVAPYIAEDGIHFRPSKTEKSTGVMVTITWTPRLKAVIERIEKIGRRNLRYVLTNQSAQQLEYSTFYSSWWRACDRAGIEGVTFHDMKAKALTDTAKKHGKKAAQTKGGHSSEKQTDDYLRAMLAQDSEATR